MSFSDMFIGTLQSRYAGMAITFAIIMVCLCILFANTSISLTNRLLIILFVILSSLPSILLSLFELSCMVTGGTKKTNSACYWFAWFISGLMILYSIIIIIYAIYVLFTYDSATKKLNEYEQKMQMTSEEANGIAQEIMKSDEEIKQPHEEEHVLLHKVHEEHELSPVEPHTPTTTPETMPSSMVKEEFNTVSIQSNEGQIHGMDYNDEYAPF